MNAPDGSGGGKNITAAPGRTEVLYRALVLLLIIGNALLSAYDMEEDCVLDDVYVQPTWEVVLRVEGRDVAIALAVPGKAGHHDVIVGVEHAASILAYADIIREAAFRLGTATGFLSLEDYDVDASEGQ